MSDIISSAVLAAASWPYSPDIMSAVTSDRLPAVDPEAGYDVRLPDGAAALLPSFPLYVPDIDDRLLTVLHDEFPFDE